MLETKSGLRHLLTAEREMRLPGTARAFITAPIERSKVVLVDLISEARTRLALEKSNVISTVRCQRSSNRPSTAWGS